MGSTFFAINQQELFFLCISTLKLTWSLPPHSPAGDFAAGLPHYSLSRFIYRQVLPLSRTMLNSCIFYYLTWVPLPATGMDFQPQTFKCTHYIISNLFHFINKNRKSFLLLINIVSLGNFLSKFYLFKLISYGFHILLESFCIRIIHLLDLLR